MSDLKTPYIDDQGKLHYDGWVSNGGGMMFNRDCLDADDPAQTYNYLLRHGIVPEDYGIYNLKYAHLEGLSKAELLNRCVELESEISSMLKSGLF
jgi:hypothetical protein